MIDEFPGWRKIDVYVLEAETPAGELPFRVGMGFIIGPRHVLTCAHVVGEALGRRAALYSERQAPAAPVRIEFASGDFRDSVETHVAPNGWWPEDEGILDGAGLNDIALLELPAGFDLPADVVAATRGHKPMPDMRVFVHGVTKEDQSGVNFKGALRGGAGGRITIHTEGGDGNIEPGYSGAAVLASRGVIGMIEQRQQNQTALFIPLDRLLRADAISNAWPKPRGSFVGALAPADAPLRTGVAGDEDAWTRMPVATRLARYLHNCDRTQVFKPLANATFADPAGRQPVIGVFGSHDDDLPEHLFDRFQSHFLVEAGVYTAFEVARLPPKWKPEETTWRLRRQRADDALKLLKVELRNLVGAESTEPAAIRKALHGGPSRTLYSEIFADQLDDEDRTLLKKWSAYWAEIAESALDSALVHLLCVKPSLRGEAVDEDAFRAQISALAQAGDPTVVVDADLLTLLDDRDLQGWLNEVAAYVPLDEQTVFELSNRAYAELLTPGAARLRQLQRWLAQIDFQDP